MWPKLKMALILFIIGAVSGLSIVGVHRLTEDAIAQNELMQEYEDYVSIFPDIDLTDFEEEEIGEDIIKRRIDAYDSSGNFLGYIFVGEARGHSGTNRILVGVDGDGDIVKVIISVTEDTPTYVSVVNDYLPNLVSQRINEVDYDTSTGATNTYNSVRNVIDAASLHVAGDPAMDAYESIFDNIDSYQTYFSFKEGLIDEEVELLDADGNVIGYAFVASIDDEMVYIMFDDSDVYKGSVSDAIDTDVYDDQVDVAAEDLDLDDDDLGAIFAEIKTLLTTSTRIERDYIFRYQELYDDDDEHIGYAYFGQSDGFQGKNVIEVHIGLDDTLLGFEVIESNDTPSYFNPVLENFERFIGETEISDDDDLRYTDLDEVDDVDDATGATSSKDSIFDIFYDAIQTHNERSGD